MNDDDGWQGLLELILKAKTPERLEELFKVFLTFEEKEDLSARYLIVKELLRGEKTQREMAKDLKVSIAKITRGSNALKELKTPLRSFLESNMN